MRYFKPFLLLLPFLLASPAFAGSTIFPDSGPIGIEVTITGQGFGKFISTKNNLVLFGRDSGLVQHWDNRKIIVRVPSKAATGPVMLKNGKKSQ